MVKVLNERDEYKRQLQFEAATSSEVLAKYLVLLDKYRALSLSAMSTGTRMAELATRYAEVASYSSTLEDILDRLRSKVSLKESMDEIDVALNIIEKAKELIEIPPLEIVPLKEEKGKGEKK